MSLFKILKGDEANLPTTYHEGYAYFTEDTGKLFIDTTSAAGGRVQVNAYAAEVLRGADNNEIDIDEIFLTSMTATVAQGGTGHSSLTANALLIGDGDNKIKVVALEDGDIAVGSTSNGITALKGTGALYALTSGSPTFGTLPLAAGGTGATSAVDARSNLDVYNKSETVTEVDKAASTAYSATLAVANWVANGDIYTYTYSNTALTCGKNANVPPVIYPTSNKLEYSYITDAEATPGTGIIFTAEKLPTTAINITIVDVK